jgi:hypothetical protein
MQLQNDLQNLITGLEIAFTGKLPISLVNPELSEILKSIIAKLPPENSFLAGTERDELYVYYEYAKVSALLGKVTTNS